MKLHLWNYRPLTIKMQKFGFYLRGLEIFSILLEEFLDIAHKKSLGMCY